jgi:hypothetical protein
MSLEIDPRLPKPMRRMGDDADEDIGQPGLRIDTVHLGRLCRLPNYAERACFPRDSP